VLVDECGRTSAPAVDLMSWDDLRKNPSFYRESIEALRKLERGAISAFAKREDVPYAGG